MLDSFVELLDAADVVLASLTRKLVDEAEDMPVSISKTASCEKDLTILLK